MKIRIRKPVFQILVQVWPVNQQHWESEVSRWLRVKVTFPRFFWEIYQPYLHHRLPVKITVEYSEPTNWLSVFYSYNLNNDMEKFIEITMLRNVRKLWYKTLKEKRDDHKLSA